MDLPLLPRFQPVELIKPLFIIFAAKIIILNQKTNIYKIPRHEIDLQLPIKHNEYFARGKMEMEFKI